MPTLLATALAVLAGYALGCFTTGYYLVRWRTGQDLRTIGTGTLGGRNAGRILGAPGVVITGIGDVGKGVLAVLVARWLAASDGVALAALFAVVAGHIWPAQLGFHGGKGVATAFGALLTLDPLLVGALGLVAAAAWMVVRSTKLAGLAAVVVLPAVSAALGRGAAASLAMSGLALLLLVAHRADLRAALAARATA